MLVSAKMKDASAGETPFQSDIHINLWKDSNKNYSLDFGIKLYDVDYSHQKGLDSICIFVPFKCDAFQIEDLGKLINTCSEISTIFNESYKMESGPDMSSLTKFTNEDDSFYLFELGDQNIRPEYKKSLNGTFITLSVPIPAALLYNTFNLYVRFRIKVNTPEAISFLKHDEQIANNFLQAAFSRMELYDFRLNDTRNTEDKVYQELITNQGYKLLEMRKVHFFFMTGAKDHVGNGNIDRMDTRMLEIEKWTKYKGEKFEHPLVAYHWKRKRDEQKANQIVHSFEAFFRNTCNSINWFLFCSYVVFLVAIGTTGSLLSTINFSLVINWTAVIGNVIMYIVFIVLYIIGKCRS